MRNGLQRTMLALMLALAMLVGAALIPAHAQSPVKAGASWVNEYGTVLRIDDVASNGRLSGTVTTKTGCGTGRAQPMTGWYFRHGDGGAITFSVSWKGCDSVTSWVGRIDPATGGFPALWSLAGASVPPGSGVVVGNNVFTPRETAKKPEQAKPKKKARKKKRRRRHRR